MYILCNIFKQAFDGLKEELDSSDSFSHLNVTPSKKLDSSDSLSYLNVTPSKELEDALEDLVRETLGFSFNDSYDYGAVRVCFDNVIKSMHYTDNRNFIDIIKIYKDKYFKILEDNHLTRLFVDVIKRIYSPNYDGKLGSYLVNNEQRSASSSAYVGTIYNSITVGMPIRIGQDLMPSVMIRDAYKFEEKLQIFVDTLKSSSSDYNLFKISGFTDSYTEDEILQMAFESIILNATSYELCNVGRYFMKYTSFLEDTTMPSLTPLVDLGSALDDELYFKVKKSDIEYETPYYFAFMLRDHQYELPNVRLSITEKDNGEKVANIIALQSSQITKRNPDIAEIIKRRTPKTSTFRYYNPEHFISLVLALGILNGLGITEIDVQDFMPIRYRKTVCDNSMNEEEAENYVKRVYDKNIACYFKMQLLTDDIEFTDYPASGDNLHLKTNDIVRFKDEFLNDLYALAYNYTSKLELAGGRK